MSAADARRTQHAATNAVLTPCGYTVGRDSRGSGCWTVNRNGTRIHTFKSRDAAVRFAWDHASCNPLEVTQVEPEDVDEETLERLRQHRREAQGV